jgi:hypothetical protein
MKHITFINISLILFLTACGNVKTEKTKKMMAEFEKIRGRKSDSKVKKLELK